MQKDLRILANKKKLDKNTRFLCHFKISQKNDILDLVELSSGGCLPFGIWRELLGVSEILVGKFLSYLDVPGS